MSRFVLSKTALADRGHGLDRPDRLDGDDRLALEPDTIVGLDPRLMDGALELLDRLLGVVDRLRELLAVHEREPNRRHGAGTLQRAAETLYRVSPV